MVLPEFVNFNINRIITHEIFQRNEDREVVAPVISAALTVLDEDGTDELSTRIVEAIGKDSKSVEMDIAITTPGSVYSHVKNIINDLSDAVFIEMSRNIAMNLAQAQTARNLPGGVLVIMDGSTGATNNKYIAVIKAELQGGFQKAANNTIGYVRDLLLTPQQKLYKIGIFLESLGSNDNNIRAFVYDYNMSRSQEHGIAVYFYDSFLGCTISHTDKYFTNRFYYETKNFIDNEGAFTDDEMFDLHTHLYSYLKSETATLNITEFSNQYISEPIKRDLYNNHMQIVVGEDGLNRSITKDISDIKTKLRMRKVTFSNRVKISAPSDAFDSNVRIIEETQDDDGNISTTVSIAGKISSLDR
jgi:hypothetical protein